MVKNKRIDNYSNVGQGPGTVWYQTSLRKTSSPHPNPKPLLPSVFLSFGPLCGICLVVVGHSSAMACWPRHCLGRVLAGGEVSGHVGSVGGATFSSALTGERQKVGRGVGRAAAWQALSAGVQAKYVVCIQVYRCQAGFGQKGRGMAWAGGRNIV